MQRAVLTAIADAATTVTGARDGWLLRTDGTDLVVAAVRPGSHATVGHRFPVAAGSAGFAAMSGQPVARRRRGDDTSDAGSLLASCHPDAPNVLAVPCEGPDGVIGVLEVVAKQTAATFAIDDIELVSLLAGIAAVALTELSVPVPVPALAGASAGRDAAGLVAALEHLGVRDPEALVALSVLAGSLASAAQGRS